MGDCGDSSHVPGMADIVDKSEWLVGGESKVEV